MRPNKYLERTRD